MTSRLPSSLAILQAVHEAGGEVAYDVAAISARLGLPKMYARRYIGGFIDRELLMKINRGAGPMLALTPTGLDAAMVRKPAPRSPPSSPPISPPPQQATRAPISVSQYLAEQTRKPPPAKPPPPPRPDRPRDRMPALSHEEMRLRKQANEIRIFFNHQRGATMMTDEIDDAIAAAGVDLGRQYDAEELGKLLRLTVAQYRHFKTATGKFPASFLPDGLTRREAKAVRDEVNRPARSAAERKRRMAKAAAKVAILQTVADLDCRQSAVFETLEIDRWKTVLQLSKLLKDVPAFQRADGKRQLHGNSLRIAILRILRRLVLAGRVETKRDLYRTGLPMDLFRRRQ
jgi:hypothetical protein